VVASKIRVIVAKAGLDGHDRGAKVVARALRDAGVEVIYTGLHQTPEQIVSAAIQEDVDAIGLSVLSGAHMTVFARVVELLREQDSTDITVFGGGIIPEADITELYGLGVAKIFGPGAPITDIVTWVNEQVGTRHAALSPEGNENQPPGPRALTRKARSRPAHCVWAGRLGLLLFTGRGRPRGRGPRSRSGSCPRGRRPSPALPSSPGRCRPSRR